MSAPASKSFNLPWHQNDHYWISVYAKGQGFSAGALEAIEKSGLQRLDNDGYGIQTPRQWKPVWEKLYAALEKNQAAVTVDAALTPGEKLPVNRPELKSTEKINALAQSLWLGDALTEGRIICYLQPVMSDKDKIFGYESFARVKAEDGSVIGGDKIVAASKALGIEHMIDRHLQVQAIKTFITSEFDGYLFVNFFPGFIHRPAVYLEALSETVKSYGIQARHIALDVTRAETPRDIAHLKSICEYGRTRGYSIALDDIGSVEGVRKLIGEIKPDFVKIDMHLVHKSTEPAAREVIRQIVELVHANKGTVIGEGVETEEMHKALKSLSVDLCQGYYFSPPMPVEAALKKSTGTA